MTKNSEEQESAAEIELHPDAWERFTEFVKRIAKAGPQHREGGDACKPINMPTLSPPSLSHHSFRRLINVGARASSRNF
jgi:hypothetical protein